MKGRKIYKVDKATCVAEQKIAYNYAFAWNTALRNIYRDTHLTAVQKSESLQKVIGYVIGSIKENGIDKKHNIDLIVHCLRNGAERYAKGYAILNSYEEIGETFFSSYEIE